MASLLDLAPSPYDADAAYTVFAGWAEGRGLPLYPAQDEALIEIVSGANIILSTPTGTGKSLVAIAAHFTALAQGRRTFYTAPIKALVSEKFFALVDIFGADNVGMVTGDSSVNPDAPIICCTAEILANIALRQGADAEVDQVVMDEFHFYADPERGWAWQVPLLTLPRVQFILMSATLGDMKPIADDLTRRTGRETALITGVDRPVPLHYSYAMTPVHETIEELLATGQSPIYIVHFSQAAALERAQAMTSMKIISREQRDEIAEAIGGFRFTTRFGQTLSRLIRSGIGVHHAGMLPKYRRLVEQLAQRGLLRVICGTDTLGVGINVPIRTVLLTALTKYDGIRMRQLSAREFHQIAGRAGRAGYDTAGTVVAEAPDHEAENARLVAKAGDDPKKVRKIVRKKAPEGFVSWGQPSFERMIAAEPELLTSHMKVSHSMILNVIARGGDAFGTMRDLIFDSHESWNGKLALARQALAIYRTLRAAGVVEQITVPVMALYDGELVETFEESIEIRLTVDLQPNFALNQPLSPFALAVFELLDPESPTYPLDMISILESTLDDPRPVLQQQQFMARGEAVAAMKAEGIEYDQRMELLEQVTWPKPLEELLDAAFEQYSATQPWIGDFALSPKSVVRDMYERAMTFADFTGFYQLAPREGLVLRYLSDAYRAARQTIPDDAKTEELLDVIEWLGELVRQVDSSLLDEWEAMVNPSADPTAPVVPPAPPSVLANPRAFRVLVRNELFRRVQLAALENWEALGELDAASGFTADAWADAMDLYFDEHDTLGTGGDARGPSMIDITEGPQQWTVRQVFDDPAGDHDWGISATIDLAESAEQGLAVVRVTSVGMVG
ncbi:DEAD/DEAH box helicase [Salinibacterium xinjiangense]|uniref:Superfamily II RNA helicase n=1 Tax=Salinibacterium xinjiangense TaxID=386302 RepID=A0A2C8ZLR2_9MICO|nr:DEAD/DEAH box helicase [Salinibacterium xinjiangense]GGK87328.1 DEAD/DEAH box helicase [Salinibacterium xinjiangense]SOE65922.1 Superfamily II RNA helicase [Salinibacterium xinjiangense]